MSKYSFEQFAAVRSYTDLSFSPDGSQVAYITNTSGQHNLWRQPVRPAADGAPLMPVQLSALVEQTARRAVWSPNGARILVAADNQGNENFQLYQSPADQGWLYPLTNKPDVRHELGSQPYSPDGRYLAYASNERNPSDFDVIVRNSESGSARILLSGDAVYVPDSWSPDGGYLLVYKENSNTDSDLYLVEVLTGEARHLTGHKGEMRFFPGPWAPDGSGFYMLCDREREFLGLAFYNLRTNRSQWVETPDWDINAVDISMDGQYLATVTNEGGYSQLRVRNTASKAARQYSDLPRGVYSDLRFSPAGPLLGLHISTPTQPAGIYFLNVETGEHWKITQSALGGIPESELVAPELVHYTSFDGRQIAAFLYKPAKLGKNERAPVVLSIHGGPEDQELPEYAYSGLYQYLLHLGIGVIATNIRGSSGYGKSFQRLVHRDWGGGELKDLEQAALFLRSLNWVNPEKVGVFGGSFGGFATLSCLTRLPYYWAVGVVICGPTNLISFCGSVPAFWKRYMRDMIGDPAEDADMLRQRSPITYIEHIKAPLLVIQGANDPRVVQAESDQLVERMRQLNRPVEYMVFPDEGHGLAKTTNRLKGLKASADWLATHLLA